MNKLLKQLLIFSFVLLVLVSVSFAVDDSNLQVTMEEQTTQEMNVEENVVDYSADNVASEKTDSITADSHKTDSILGDSQKTVKMDDDSVPVEYVNITKSNYKNYFSVMGGGMYLGRGIISSNNSLILNMQYLPDNINMLGFDENSAKFVNRSLTITSDRNLVLTNVEVDLASNFKELTLENLKFTYNNDYSGTDYFTIADNVQHCVLRNVSIDMNKDNVASGYLINIVGNTLIENSHIRGRFMETVIDWIDGPKTPDAYGIRVYARDCILRNNTIEIISSGNSGEDYHSLYGIYLMTSNTTLTNNTILMYNCTGYAYGVVVRSSNNTLSCNNITVSSHTYSNAVTLELVSFKNNVINNNYVNVTASYGFAPWGPIAVAYGLQMLDFNYQGGAYPVGGTHPDNNSFINNTIVGSAAQIYGIELYGTGNTNLSGNTINITGRTPMGIAAIGYNVTVADNTIINNGEHNHSEPTVDYLEAINTGLYTSYASGCIYMINNNITSINGRGILIKNSIEVLVNGNTVNVTDYDYAVEVIKKSNQIYENNTVENNTLITTTHTGDKAVNATENNTVRNNIPVEISEYVLKVDTTEFTIGSKATITAKIYYGDEVATNITKGKVTFKINGKTLKDTNGKVIYAKLINGTATIENYTIPDSWNTEGCTIQAVYSGSSDCNKLSSNKTTITVITPEASITTSDVTASVGSTVTLTATINTATPVNMGKVIFKINGKTIKDANGKVIYVKVTGGKASVDYAIPSDMKSKDYVLTATFISNEYDRLEDTKTLTVES